MSKQALIEKEEVLEILNKAFEVMLEEDAPHFTLENSVLKASLVVHVNLQKRWSKFYRRVESYCDAMQLLVDQKYSERLQHIARNLHIDFSANERKRIVEGDEEYIKVVHLQNKFNILRSSVKDMVDVVDRRYWILKQYVEVVVNDADGVII